MKVALMLVLLVVSQSLATSPLASVNTFSAELKEYKFCNFCIQITGQVINQLLNIILNAGVVVGCEDICNELAQKTGNKVVGELCDLVCTIEGVEEFIKLVEKADLDPIYYCELIDACEIKDDGDAKVMSLNVVPKQVTYGNDFAIELQFKTVNGTGTGEIDLGIETVDGIPLGQNELMLPQPAGTYGVKWSATAAPDPDCDPTQGPCEMWLPGNYTVKVALCNGECGSKHPHSAIYDQAQTTFSVVKN